MQVVQQDGRRPVRSRLGERAPQRLDEGSLARVLCREPELGQERCKIGRQVSARLREPGRSPQALAQHLGDRRVRLGDRRSRGARVGRQTGLLECVDDELCLADAGLARDEDAATEAVADRGARSLQRHSLFLPADQDAVPRHAPSVGRR